MQIRCIDCHGTLEKNPEEYLLIESDPNTQKLLVRTNLNPNLKKKVRAGDTVLVNSSGSPMPHIKKIKKNWVLYSKITGKKHIIPLLKNLKPSIAHQIPKHMQEMECSTCHARWAAIDWGMHVIREKIFAPEKWRNWNLSDPMHLPMDPTNKKLGMLDWLTAKSLPHKMEADIINEYWWTLFSDSGWSEMIMGKNSRGKYSIIKPRYQYFITDQTGTSGLPLKRAEPPLTLNNSAGLIWTDYSPHTIRKTVRSCEDCHQNSLAVGLGDPLKISIQNAEQFFYRLKQNNQVHKNFQLRQGIDPNGQALQTLFPQDKSRFLNKNEITTLQKPSNRYRAFRSLNLRELKFSRLLSRKEFPYDVKHHISEQNLGESQPREDLFYDVGKNLFVEIEIPNEAHKPLENLKPKPRPESIMDRDSDLTREPPQDIKKEGIIEFFYDIFQEAEKEPDSLPTLDETNPL